MVYCRFDSWGLYIVQEGMHSGPSSSPHGIGWYGKVRVPKEHSGQIKNYEGLWYLPFRKFYDQTSRRNHIRRKGCGPGGPVPMFGRSGITGSSGSETAYIPTQTTPRNQKSSGRNGGGVVQCPRWYLQEGLDHHLVNSLGSSIDLVGGRALKAVDIPQWLAFEDCPSWTCSSLRSAHGSNSTRWAILLDALLRRFPPLYLPCCPPLWLPSNRQFFTPTGYNNTRHHEYLSLPIALYCSSPFWTAWIVPSSPNARHSQLL